MLRYTTHSMLRSTLLHTMLSCDMLMHGYVMVFCHLMLWLMLRCCVLHLMLRVILRYTFIMFNLVLYPIVGLYYIMLHLGSSFHTALYLLRYVILHHLLLCSVTSSHFMSLYGVMLCRLCLTMLLRSVMFAMLSYIVAICYPTPYYEALYLALPCSHQDMI